MKVVSSFKENTYEQLIRFTKIKENKWSNIFCFYIILKKKHVSLFLRLFKNTFITYNYPQAPQLMLASTSTVAMANPDTGTSRK